MRTLEKPGSARIENRPEQAEAVPANDVRQGKEAILLDQLAPLPTKTLTIARNQLAVGRKNATPDITLLGTYFMGLLTEEERRKLESVGMSSDLQKWRPYGVDDLDLSLINLFYRRRLRESSRQRMLTDK